MATKIVTKNSSTASAVPTASDLVQGELAVNVADKRLFTEDNTGTIVELGTNPSTIDINAGSIDGTAIGASSASTGAFTTLTATGLTVDTNTLYVDSTNNRVGIGTSSPVNTLSIKGSVNQLDIETSTAGVTLESIDRADHTAQSDLSYYARHGEHKFFNSAYTQAMTIDSSGNVGIGTSSPNSSYKMTLRHSSANGVRTENTVGGFAALSCTDSSSSHGVLDCTNAQRFSVNGTERMRIDSSGNLLVGTTSGGAKFRVSGSAVSGRVATIQGNTSGDLGNAALLVGKYDNNNSTSQVYVQFSMNNDSTASGQINANGASQVAFGSWSDRRLKENITDLTSQLENIKSLRPVEFDYIEAEGGGHQLGFIAQEVEEIYPDLVGERSDGMKTLSNLGKWEARLVKAIQEQQTLIESLTARIAALEE